MTKAKKEFTITLSGAVAQLGERCVRNAEVGSSILLGSTIRLGVNSTEFSLAHGRPTYSEFELRHVE